MSKSPKRRRIAWASGVALVLMLLVPPWVYTVEGRPTGDTFYAEIVPGPRPPHCAAKVICGVMVDNTRLGLQVLAWAVLFGVPWYLVSRRRRD
jgi:hypothetical protein